MATSKKPDPVAVVGQRIRALRAARGMTVDDLSAATGLSGGHISKLERSLQVPTVTTLAALARAFGIEAIDLLIDPATSIRHALVAASAEVSDEELERIRRRLRATELQVIEGRGKSVDTTERKKRRRVSRRRRKEPSSGGASGSSASGSE